MAVDQHEDLDTQRLVNSNAGKLIKRLIREGLLTREDLNHPDIINLINNCEEVSIQMLSTGDLIYFIDETEPKRSLIRGAIIYKGEFLTLGYGDTSMIVERGVKISGVNCFPESRLVKYTQIIFPKQFEIIRLNQKERLFRVTPEAFVRSGVQSKDLIIAGLVPES